MGATPAVASPSATDTAVPSTLNEELMSKETEDTLIQNGILRAKNEGLADQNKRLTDQNAALISRIEKLELFNKAQEEKSRTEVRKSRLSLLKRAGFDINIPDKLEQFKNLDDSIFETFCKEVETNWKSSAAPIGGALRLMDLDETVKQPENFAATNNDYEFSIKDLESFQLENDIKRREGENGAVFGQRLVQAFVASKKKS